MAISEQLRSMAMHIADGWRPSSEDVTDGETEKFVGWTQTWLQSGFPQIVVGHRLAASLACTSAPAESVSVQFLPWRSFLVLAPTGLFPHPDGGELEALWVVPGDPAGASTDGWHVESFFSDDLTRSQQDSFNVRHLETYRRLIVGVVIELDSPRHRERIVQRPLRTHHRRRSSALPLAWTFRISRDIKIDLRKEIRSYCLGTVGKSPTIQVLVRGHYRRQPCGPDLADRRWIHIEPYWRGPEDAPIGVRSHVLVDDG